MSVVAPYSFICSAILPYLHSRLQEKKNVTAKRFQHSDVSTWKYWHIRKVNQPSSDPHEAFLLWD
jgi:hypothetical protein